MLGEFRSSRWPSSVGGGLQNRRGWCDSSTGFQPSLFKLRLGEPFSNMEFGRRSAESIVRADCNVEAFGAGQRTLNSISRQEDFTFKFERQRNVEQIEAATAESFGVFG